MNIADKLTTIAENELKVYNAGKFALLDESKYMHPTISGAVISVNDVSPIEHSLGVKVGSKNLLPYPYFDSSKSSVGATITVNEDRSISFSGTPTSYVGFVLYKGNALVKSGTFTISVGDLINISTTLFIYDGSGATLKTYSFTKSVTVNADDYPTAATWNITMARAASNQQINGTAYPQIELGTTSTSYTPYVPDLTAVKVSRCGKNLFDADAVLPALENPNLPYDVCKWIKQKDGSFFMQNIGALERYKWFENTTGYGGQVSFSLATKANNGTGELNTLNIIFIYTDGSKESLNVRNDTDYTTYTFKTDAKKTLSYIYQSYHSNVATYIKDIMITFGTDTEYEPYNPHTVTANADGTVEGLTSISPNMTLFTDTDGVSINCQYYRDIDLYIDNLITDIALTGGE